MAAGPWPFGTRLRIEGVGVVTITDRIGCCTDLDIYVQTETAARAFGRQHLHVEVLP
jgi:3D (Asp-Asp-Asp) domain-containing protein